MADEYKLPITKSGVLRLNARFRERYLTTNVETAIVQAVGYELSVKIWSDRSNVDIRIPLDGYRAARPFQRSINSWGIYLDRWRSPGKSGKSNGGWWNSAEIITEYDESDDKRVVEATVTTFDGVVPDV